MTRKKMFAKKFVALLLVAMMVITIIPTSVLAQAAELMSDTLDGTGELSILIKETVSGRPTTFNVLLSNNDKEYSTTFESKGGDVGATGSITCGIADGTYTLTISAAGYANYTQTLEFTGDRIDLTLYNSTSVNDGKKDDEPKFGVIPLGDVNGDGEINKADADKIVESIDVKTPNLESDVNGDKAVNMTDLAIAVRNADGVVLATPVHTTSSLQMTEAKAEIPDTTKLAIAGVTIEGSEDTAAVVAEAILSPSTDSYVSLTPATDENGEIKDISPESPVEVALNVASTPDGEETASQGIETEAITIVPPVNSNNTITDCTMDIEAEEDGNTVIYKAQLDKQDNTEPDPSPIVKANSYAMLSNFMKIKSVSTSTSNIDSDITVDTTVKGVTVESDGTIVVNIGKKIAIKKVSIKVTGSKSGKLADIAKVEFLGNFAERLAEPQLSIPSEISVTNTEADGLGYRTVKISWKSEPNVTGYEVSITGPDYKKTKIVTQNKAEFIGDSFNGTVNSFNTYEVKVRSINGDWKSDWSEIYKHYVDTKKKPNKPEYMNAVGSIKTVKVSWRKLWDTQSWKVYYKQLTDNSDKQIKTAAQAIEKGFTMIEAENPSITLTEADNKLIPGERYIFYVAGCNLNGDSGLSTPADAIVKRDTVAKMPQYRLINTPITIGEKEYYANHITGIRMRKENGDIDFTGGETAKLGGSETVSNLALVDNNISTSFDKVQWFNDTFTVDFDGYYEVNKIRMSFNAKGDPYFFGRGDGAKVNYIGMDGKSHSVFYSLSVKRDNEGKRYMELTLDQPVTGKSFEIRLVVYGLSRTNRLTVDEARFYYYDNLEDMTANLFEDNMRTVLKKDVTEKKIKDLITRAETPDPVSGEYNPNKGNVLKDLNYALLLCRQQIKEDDVYKVNSSITLQADTTQQFSCSLSDFQPLGYVAAEGDTVIVYVSRPNLARGSNANLYLVFTQYHPECSAWRNESFRLKAGRNEITVPDVANATRECGGAMYVKYTGAKNAEEYTVRVSGAVQKIPTLNVAGMTENARKAAIKTYVNDLRSYVNNIEDTHNDIHKGSENINVDYDYDKKNCFLNSTEIIADNVFYSLPATEILKALENHIFTNNAETQLLESIKAMEQEIDYFYQFKGLSKNEPNNSPDRYPTSKINIRYCTMFTGAFMYAASKHIGIEFGSSGGVINTKPFEVDENGKYKSGSFSGWGIAHEIGHCINTSAYQRVEVTNNIFAQVAQSKTEQSFRTSWQNVYNGVATGTVGHTGNLAVQLGMYWQLHLAYDQNYLYKVYSSAKEMRDNLFYARVDSIYRDPTNVEKTGELKIPLKLNSDADQNFMRVTCVAAGKDILSFFRAWGFIPNNDTIAFASQFEKEERLIQYFNDAAHIAAIEDLPGMTPNTTVTANIKGVKDHRINNYKVEIEISDNNQVENAIIGYEIKRDGKVVAFIGKDATGTTKYTDLVTTENNKAFVYTVTGVDRQMKTTASTKLPEVKVTHDGTLDRSKWTVSTNMTATTDSAVGAVEDDPDNDVVPSNGRNPAQKVQSEIGNIIDEDESTVYFGSTTGGDSNRPYVIINLGGVEQITALKYTPIPNSYGKSYGGYSTTAKQPNLTNFRLYTYKIEVSIDGINWTTVKNSNVYKAGTVATSNVATMELLDDVVCPRNKQNPKYHANTDDPITLYFNKQNADGTMDPFMYTYDAAFVKITSTGMSAAGISDIQLLGPTSDNIDMGAAGTLSSDFVYSYEWDEEADDYDREKPLTIPKDSYVFFGTYKGDPAYSVVELRDQDGVILGGEQVILADVPEKGALGETNEGMWIFWMPPTELTDEEKEATENKYETYKDQMKNVSTVQAELYRVMDAFTMEGERMTSNSLHFSTSAINNPITIDRENYSGAENAVAVQPKEEMVSYVKALDEPAVMTMANFAPRMARSAVMSFSDNVPVTDTDDVDLEPVTPEEPELTGTPAISLTPNKDNSKVNFTIAPVNASVGAYAKVFVTPGPITDDIRVEWDLPEESKDYVSSTTNFNAQTNSTVITLYVVANKGLLGEVSGRIVLPEKIYDPRGYYLSANVTEVNSELKAMVEEMYETNSYLEYDHHYIDRTVTKKAECNKPGEAESRCEFCGEVHKEIIPEVSHNYVVNGEHVKCSVCGDIFKNGTWTENGEYYDENGLLVRKGVNKIEENYFFFENGEIIKKEGLVKDEQGNIYYVQNTETGALAVSREIEIDESNANGIITGTEYGKYLFGTDAKMSGRVVEEPKVPGQTCNDHKNNSMTGLCPTCSNRYDGFTRLIGYTIPDGSLTIRFEFALKSEHVLEETKIQVSLGEGEGVESTNEYLLTELGTTVSDEETFVNYTFEVSPANIDKDLTITFDGYSYGLDTCAIMKPEYHYSIKEIMGDITFEDDNTLSNAEKKLTDASLFYLDAASKYHNNETITVTDEMKNVTPSALSQFKATTSGKLPTGLTYVGTSVTLGTTITVVHNFKATKATIATKYGLKKDSETGYYTKTIENVGIAEINNISKSVQIGSWKLNYSVMSYAYSVLTNSKSDENLKSLAKAIYLYYIAFEELTMVNSQ